MAKKGGLYQAILTGLGAFNLDVRVLLPILMASVHLRALPRNSNLKFFYYRDKDKNAKIENIFGNFGKKDFDSKIPMAEYKFHYFALFI